MAVASCLRPFIFRPVPQLSTVSSTVVCPVGLRYVEIEAGKPAETSVSHPVKFHALNVKKISSSHEDPSLFYDPVIVKFINHMMLGGQKAVARRLFKEALLILKEQQLEKWKKASEKEKESIELSPVKIFKEAFDHVKPVVGTVRVMRGGQGYQVPAPLSSSMRQHLASKWIVEAARKRPAVKHRMPQRLADEINDAYHFQGASIKKKNDLHKLAAANRALAHYRWW